MFWGMERRNTRVYTITKIPVFGVRERYLAKKICTYYTPIHNKMRMRMFPSLFTPENQPKVLLPETRVVRVFLPGY